MKTSIRKHIELIKEEKERKIVSLSIVESRFESIGGKDFFDKFETLSENQKLRMSFLILQEMNTILRYDLVTEQDLASAFKNIFGNLFSSGLETIVEPILRRLLSAFGLDPKSYFSNTVVSFLTTNPSELISAMSSCQKFSKLLAEALAEAFVMEIQESFEMEGALADFVRNSLGGAIKDISFIDNLTNKISSVVCNLFSNLGSNAENLIGRIQSGS
jgi:hypothetical protein